MFLHSFFSFSLFQFREAFGKLWGQPSANAFTYESMVVFFIERLQYWFLRFSFLLRNLQQIYPYLLKWRNSPSSGLTRFGWYPLLITENKWIINKTCAFWQVVRIGNWFLNGFGSFKIYRKFTLLLVKKLTEFSGKSRQIRVRLRSEIRWIRQKQKVYPYLDPGQAKWKAAGRRDSSDSFLPV